MKNWFKKSFKFSNSEEKGRIALLFCFWVFFFAVLTKVYWYPSINEEDDIQLELIYTDTLTVESLVLDEKSESLRADALQMFDPNRVDKEFLESINLPKNIATTWLKYLHAGGKFYKSEDVKRLYGLQDSTFAKLKPFFKFEKGLKNPTYEPKKQSQIGVKKHLSPPFDINTADSALFTTVKGIGPFYASRIIRYRKALGGFVKTDQLLEVYGIDSASILESNHLFQLDSIKISRININEVEFKSLLRHPYFNFRQVKSIINYRQQHGKFEDKSSLLKIVVLDSAWFQKVEPYIEIK